MNRLLTISTLALALTATAAPAAFAADDLLTMGGAAPSAAKVSVIGKTEATISSEIKKASDEVCAKDFSDFLSMKRCVRDTYSRGMEAAKAQLLQLGQVKPERVAFRADR